MRMWMVDVTKMCRQHLLGEHREIHTMIGTLKRKISIDGYLDGLYDISKLVQRHTEVVEEMMKRGYRHLTPLGTDIEIINKWLVKNNGITGWVDVKENELELCSRCKRCKELLETKPIEEEEVYG